MRRRGSLAVVCAVAAGFFGVGTAAAAQGRAGHAELLFGLGSLSSQEATLDSFNSVQADQGTTFDLRFQIHFSDNIGLQIEGMGEAERTHLNTVGFVPLSDDTTTGFLFANALFDLMPGPITPYLALGVGNFHHRSAGLGVTENGSAFDAAAGIEGHSRGPLIWAFEARYVHYAFSDFADAWNRYQFSGQLGFRF